MSTKRRYSITATTYDKRGRMIARAQNSYVKTHPRQAHYAACVDQGYKVTLHAEVAAIIKSRKQEIHSIKIERYDREGNPRDAAPCRVCQHAIELAGIRWVSYTTNQTESLHED